MSEIELSPDQSRALDQVHSWLKKRGKKTLTLGGYAGTGKTTLIRELLRHTHASVCAFTGKAAYVLQGKGVPATTMHRLIYRPVTSGGEVHFERVPRLPSDLVIVDEASMVDAKLMEDLESFKVKVLYVGDHGQLEPVGDDPGLMRDPEIRLEQIHRQASGSPIIQFAHHVRQGQRPRSFGEEAELLIRKGAPSNRLLDYDAVLCGYNRTRTEVNAKIRDLRGFEGPLPLEGERVICLRNHREYGVFNGMQATVVSAKVKRKKVVMVVKDDLGEISPEMSCDPEQFGSVDTRKQTSYSTALWDWGYALTVHKSQGSEWEKVMVLEQIGQSWSPSRWSYTAATRASQKLTYIKH